MINSHIDNLVKRLPELAALKPILEEAVQIMLLTYNNGGKIITCGNGGSAADAEHIVGELMKGFLLKRPLPEEIKKRLKNAGCAQEVYEHLQSPIPAISLVGGIALPTAFANDVNGVLSFAQQILGLAKKTDTLMAISTSGNSPNVIYAAQTAKALGVKIISMTGKKESRLSATSDLTIMAPSCETPIIQEYHLAIYHTLCAQLEYLIFGD